MIGEIISHYKILEKLGEGGMGVVYKARDIKLERFAALKFLPMHLVSNKDLQNRFILEAQLTSSLDHPNICTIYEIGEYLNKQLFISMAFYEGETLKQKCEKGIIKLSNAINYSMQIARGMLKAHEKGIIHRDIKPANIIITNEGLVKILDFGIAKFLQDVTITKDHSTPGTTAYMSPEQILEDEIDHRTDIFSFGIVLHEMLTGNHPFKGEYDQAIIYSILNEEPEKINKFNPGIPLELSGIVYKCLAKRKSERYNSFEEIIKELQSLSMQPATIEKNTDSKETGLIKNYIPRKSNLFIGREKQVNILRERITSTLQGYGKAIFISGEPGIGKTQLIFNAINDYTITEIYVLYGRCLLNEGGLPYHPFISAIKNGIEDNDNILFNKLSKKAASQGINITNRIPLIKSFKNLSSDYSNTLFHKEQLWDAIFTLFRIIANDKPLIMIIDDIQWADKSTLELISFIARNIENIPFLLIGVYRPYDTASGFDLSALNEFIRSLRIENLAEKIELERLPEKDTGEIVGKLFNNQKVDEKIKRKIFRQSEGNPLFINELINLMKDKNYIYLDNEIFKLREEDEEETVSERVQDVIKRRLENLDIRTREILEAASCQGEYFQSDVLAGCLNISRIDLLKILQALENDSHIIRHENKFYRFDHILIRDVLYESILPELREEYHRIISNWLIERYENKEEFASRIAYHLISAGEEEKAIGYLITAANKAKDFYALEEALNHYTKLLTIVENVKPSGFNKLPVEEGLGDVYSSLGKSEEAINHYMKYLDMAKTSNQQTFIIRALRKLSESYRISGNINKAEELCTEAVDLAYENGDKRETAEALNTLAFINSNRGNYNKTIEISNSVLLLSEEIKDLKNKSVSLSNLGFAYWHLGNYPIAMEKFDGALSIQRSIGDNREISISLNYLSLVYLKLGKFESALNSALESVDIKKRIAEYRTLPGSLNVAGDSYRDIGNIDKAIEYHSQSLTIASEHQNKGAMCDNLRDLGEDYFLNGDFKKSLGYYLDALKLSISSGIKWYETRSCISLAEFYLLQNQLKEAREYLNRGLESSYKLDAKELIIEALWKDALIKAKEDSIAQSIETLENSIEIAHSLNHKTFLWKLYLDYSKILIRSNKNEKAEEAINKSKNIAQDIINDFRDENLKNTYLKTPKLKELFLI